MARKPIHLVNPCPSSKNKPIHPPNYLEGLLQVDAARKGHAKNGPKQRAHQQPVHDGTFEHALFFM